MAIQTVYKETQDAGRLGAIVDTNDKTLISCLAEAATGFGLPVVQGAADNAARVPASGDAAILGITVRERSSVDDTWQAGDSMRVMTRGGIWVTASVDVSAGDPVDVVVATGAFTNTGGVTIANARYDSSGLAGELVKVRLA